MGAVSNEIKTNGDANGSGGEKVGYQPDALDVPDATPAIASPCQLWIGVGYVGCVGYSGLLREASDQSIAPSIAATSA